MNREQGSLYSSTDRMSAFDRSTMPTTLRPWSPSTLGAPSPTQTYDDRPPLSRSTLLLTGMWLFIGLVAAYDVYLSVKYQETLRFQELNPVGQWLLAIDDGSIAVFMGAKLLGTVITLGTIQVLYWYKRRIGMTVAAALASCQAVLGAYLLFG